MNRSLRSLQSTTTLGGQILLLGVAFIGAGLLAPDIAVARQYWDGQDTARERPGFPAAMEYGMAPPPIGLMKRAHRTRSGRLGVSRSFRAIPAR